MLDSTAIAALAGGFELLCNKALSYDPGSRARLQALSGQCLALHCQAPNITLYLLPGAELKLQQFYDGDVSCSLSGRADQLLALASTDVHSLHGTGVTLAGSTQFLAELQSIVKTLEVDWEMWLADSIGTLPAHFIAERVRQARQWSRGRTTSAKRMTGEYLREESRAALGKNEFNSFVDDVNQTRMALDRLQARIERLSTPRNTLSE